MDRPDLSDPANVYDNGAREWLKEFPLFSAGNTAASSPPQLVIIGLGRMGESLAVHAARAWYEHRGTSSVRMRLTIVDRIAAKRLESLQFRFPRLGEACDSLIQGVERGDHRKPSR